MWVRPLILAIIAIHSTYFFSSSAPELPATAAVSFAILVASLAISPPAPVEATGTCLALALAISAIIFLFLSLQ